MPLGRDPPRPGPGWALALVLSFHASTMVPSPSPAETWAATQIHVGLPPRDFSLMVVPETKAPFLIGLPSQDPSLSVVLNKATQIHVGLPGILTSSGPFYSRTTVDDPLFRFRFCHPAKMPHGSTGKGPWYFGGGLWTRTQLQVWLNRGTDRPVDCSYTRMFDPSSVSGQYPASLFHSRSLGVTVGFAPFSASALGAGQAGCEAVLLLVTRANN